MDFVTVRETPNPLEAPMIEGLLQANGFTSNLIGAHDAYYPPTYPIEVQVPSDDADAARQLLADHEDSDDPTVHADAERSRRKSLGIGLIAVGLALLTSLLYGHLIRLVRVIGTWF